MVQNQDSDTSGHLKKRVEELEVKLESERKLNADKTSMMRKTIAETEDLAKHLQSTTLALIQERQIANTKAEREQLINQWIEKINSYFDLDSLMRESTKEIGDYFKTDRCGIIISHSQSYSCFEYQSEGNARRLNYKTIQKNSYFQEAKESKEDIVLNSIPPEKVDTFLKDACSFIAIPLVLKKELAGLSSQDVEDDIEEDEDQFGLLYLMNCTDERNWSKVEHDLLKAVSMALAIAIEKAILYMEAKERTKHAELLNSLTAQIRSSLNLREILARTVTELGQALKASRCFLYFDGYISDEYCDEGIESIAEKTKHLILDKFSTSDDFAPVAINNLYDKEYMEVLTEEEVLQLKSSGAVSALASPLHFQGILQGWIVFHCFEPRFWTTDERKFVESAASQVIVAMTQSRMYEKLNSYQEKLSRELKQAARVQTSLIGGDVFDVNLETSVFYKAHSNVSGDFYWVAELAPDTVGVLIGDVSGKGPAAALLTGYLLGEFNSACSNSALAWYPDKLISFLCQSILYQNSSSDFYATAWYGVFDLNAGTLEYTNAGHLSPYLIKNGQITMLDGEGDAGMPLGLINPKEISEIYEARKIDFNEGDKMVLITDGVLDQKTPDGNFVPKNWIQKNLEKLHEKSVKEITFELNETLNEMSKDVPLSDDRLMISIEQSNFPLREIDAEDPAKFNKLLDEISEACDGVDMPKERRLDLRLGITEALTNAIRYGLSKNPMGKIKVGYRAAKGSFKMTILDPGPGFNWQVYNYTMIHEVEFLSEGGRGIPLLKEIFDKVTWNYTGNHLGLFMYW